MSNLDEKLREILADAKAKVVDSMNATTVAPGSVEIELTHTGKYKDGDIVSVQIGNNAGHPSYTGTLKGYKLTTTKEVPYKIDVGTQIRLVSWQEAIAQIKQAFADEIEAAELRVIKKQGWPYEHAVAFPELRKELGMCLHEDYAFNGGKCSACGKQFPGEWI